MAWSKMQVGEFRKTLRRDVREAYDNANEALCLLFQHFANTHEAYIEVDGRALGDWLKTARYTHRIHVRVTPSRGR